MSGRQYVAFIAGQGGFHVSSYAPLVPAIKLPTERAASVWVFELPSGR